MRPNHQFMLHFFCCTPWRSAAVSGALWRRRRYQQTGVCTWIAREVTYWRQYETGHRSQAHLVCDRKCKLTDQTKKSVVYEHAGCQWQRNVACFRCGTGISYPPIDNLAKYYGLWTQNVLWECSFAFKDRCTSIDEWPACRNTSISHLHCYVPFEYIHAVKLVSLKRATL